MRSPSLSARDQRRHLPERAGICIEEINTGAVVTTAEPKGTLGDPSTLSYALHGSHFTRWDRYHHKTLDWDHLERVNGRVELGTVVDLPEHGEIVSAAFSLGPAMVFSRYPKPIL